MPPFAGVLPQASAPPEKSSDVITINVGGEVFQTTPRTLTLSGPQSLLSTLAATASNPTTPFIDRDPDLFSVLLSLLRTGRLPSKADAFDLQDLVDEAQFYGIQSLLKSSLTQRSQFDTFGLRKSLILPLNGRDSPSAVSTTPTGSVHVAHGSKITSFDWSLSRKFTVLTCFPVVDSLVAISPSVGAAGATDFPGLRVIDLSTGSVKSTLHWSSYPPSTGPNSTVQAIGLSPDLLFSSFESCRRNASAILAFDIESMKPLIEIGRQEVYGAELDSAIPATKLRWVSSSGLLMAAGSHSGPLGLVGNIKLWDVRSSPATPVWELKEKSDCFADVAVSDSLSAIFKVGVNSGEVYMVDLRKLSSSRSSSESEEDPWVCLGDARKRGASNGKSKEGIGHRIEGYGNNVFCSRGGDVEVWSEIVMETSAGGWGSENGGMGGRVMRRNVMGSVKDCGGNKITQVGFGGNRMILARKDQQCVEVWESASRG